MPEHARIIPPAVPGPPPGRWKAAWARHPSAAQEPVGVYHFRKQIVVEQRPRRCLVHVSADNRYELFVNGERVSLGPARGDIAHWRYDTIDLAPHLHEGENTLAAVTWYLGDMAPMAQMQHAPAFLMMGDPADAVASQVDTPGGWRCLRNPAYSFHTLGWPEIMGYYVAGPAETVSCAAYPWGWQMPGFDSSGWPEAVNAGAACPRGDRDAPAYWLLVPNRLPPMEDTPSAITTVRRVEGLAGSTFPFTVPANSAATILLDNGVLTTGYPELLVNRGRDAIVRLRYAEALGADPKGNKKGQRDRVEGLQLFGNYDTWVTDGEERRLRPLWWRTLRYVQIEVETKGQPLTVAGLDFRFSAYPFEPRGHFASSDDSLKRIWEVGWRTARLCAHESYMDCPYYEQLQYGGDTRIQCLVSLYAAGDERLVRNAIQHLNDSRLPDGITQSRYPSRLEQNIPPFSLWWVGMVHDFHMYRDDPAFVASMLPGIRAVLTWYEGYLRKDYLLGPMPWWNFVDWVREWPDGVPPGAHDGGSSILSLQLVLALREAAELEQDLGLPALATHYRQLAQRVGRSVMDFCGRTPSGLVQDAPQHATLSQHATSLAILAGLYTRQRLTEVAPKLLTLPPTELRQATFYFRFYLHRALGAAGLADHYLEWLQPWRDMLAMGLTTWAENPEPVRSDCHAWSAHPNVAFLDTVLGVRSAAPGFSKVLIEPHLGPLAWAEGAVPHPRGEIHVRVERTAAGLKTDVKLPEGVERVEAKD